MNNPLYEKRKDTDAEKNGAWFDYCETVDGEGNPVPLRFKLRRCGGSNVEFLSQQEKYSKPYRHMTRKGKELTVETRAKIMIELFCNYILVDWENVQDEQDEFVDFSPEKAKEIFTALPDVMYELIDEAQGEEVFLAEQRGEDEKN